MTNFASMVPGTVLLMTCWPPFASLLALGRVLLLLEVRSGVLIVPDYYQVLYMVPVPGSRLSSLVVLATSSSSLVFMTSRLFMIT